MTCDCGALFNLGFARIPITRNVFLLIIILAHNYLIIIAHIFHLADSTLTIFKTIGYFVLFQNIIHSTKCKAKNRPAVSAM